MSKRTIKKHNFAHKYVECGNASEAYRFAYNAENMKPESVKRVASELLKDLYVASTIEQLQKELAEKLKISAEQVIKEYARIAFFDIRKLYDKNWRVRDFSDLAPEITAAISSFESEEINNQVTVASRTITKVKTHDKLKALDALARHLGLFKPEGRQEPLVIVKDFTGNKNLPVRD